MIKEFYDENRHDDDHTVALERKNLVDDTPLGVKLPVDINTPNTQEFDDNSSEEEEEEEEEEDEEDNET